MTRLKCFSIGVTTLTVVILTPAADVLACSCPSSGPPCQNAFQVDAVFAGTVRSISALPDDGPPLRPGEARIPLAVRVDFAAVMTFRGIPAPTVSVVTPGSGPACGYEFKQGERYLVYASRAADGTGLVTGICSRTRPLAAADDDLRFLQRLSAPRETCARIYGTFTHWEQDLATGQPREYGPVPDVLVTVRGPGSAFDAWTDARGRYEVTVPPGTYEVSASPPPGFSTQYLQQAVELRDVRACAVADFGIRFDGRITGSLRQSSNEPAEGISVEVMAADAVGKPGNIQTLRVATDAGGRFEFTEVPPGRYVIGVDLTRTMNTGISFPMTFHPGTANAALATVVQINGGQQHDLEPMTLPQPRRQYRLTGTVVLEDGTPAPGRSVSLWDGGATWRQVAVGIQTDFDGTFSFVVHEGLSYVVRASHWDQAQRKSVSGTVGPVVVTGDTGPLKVLLSAGR
jgi:hypothetical protein